MTDKDITYNNSNYGTSFPLIAMYALILCPHIIAFPTTDLSYMIIRLLQIFCIGVLLFLLIKKRSDISTASKVFAGLINLWWITMIAISFAKVPTLKFTQVYYWITIWDIILIAETYWKKNLSHHLYNLAVLFSVLVYLNTFLYIIFPDGLWVDSSWIGTGSSTRYLFGNYNQTGLIALVAIMLNGIFLINAQRGSINMFFLCCTAIGTVVDMGSMTSSVGLIILVLNFMFRNLIKHPYFLIAFFLFLYVAFFSIIVWQGQDIQDWKIVNDFIENVLGKNSTFTSRIYLWLNSISLIHENPIWGYGAQGIEWMVANIGGSGPHNLWLMILLEGGFVLCSLLVIIIIHTLLSMKIQNTREGAFSAVCLCCILLMSLFETYNVVCVFFVLIVAYYTRLAKLNQNTEES